MSVRLRLRRIGKKKQPYYRIVAIDSRAAREGRYIENLGTYNPLSNPAQIKLNEDRALYWLSQGAIPSDTVRSFLRKKGVLLKWHLMKRGFDETNIGEELKKWEALQLERQKRLEALIEQKKREMEEKEAEEEKPEAEVKEEVLQEPADREVETAEVSEEPKKEVSEKKGKLAKASKKKEEEKPKAEAESKEELVQEAAATEVEAVEESKEEVPEKKAKPARAARKVVKKKEKPAKASKERDKKDVKASTKEKS